MLTELIMVIILQYKQISNDHTSETNEMLYQLYLNLKKEIENVKLNERKKNI